ncbi:MAG: extracellular solute-binding protein [Nostoc sp.]|uniref:extracellular solute-binding protein n=1 Tax=Nostoc sp. TaxID=1180 RepID=UPI002FFCBBB8
MMKKYLLAASVTALVVNLTFTKQTLAATLAAPPEVTLYAAGSLRGGLSEVASAFTQEYGIPVKTEFASSGSLKDRLLAGEKADVFASADLGNALALNQNFCKHICDFFSMQLVIQGYHPSSHDFINFTAEY